jgi:hypothetical protein
MGLLWHFLLDFQHGISPFGGAYRVGWGKAVLHRRERGLSEVENDIFDS